MKIKFEKLLKNHRHVFDRYGARPEGRHRLQLPSDAPDSTTDDKSAGGPGPQKTDSVTDRRQQDWSRLCR